MDTRQTQRTWRSSASSWEWYGLWKLGEIAFDKWQALKRIEVIADDENEIVEAVQRMSSTYDFVVTSGGIGPTYVHFSHSRDLLTSHLTVTMISLTNP
jgi:hypothetical protein